MKQTKGPFTLPVSPKIAKLRDRLELLNAQGAVLRAEDRNRGIQFSNGLGQMLQGAAYRQDNITSLQPIITANMYAVITLQYSILMYMYQTHGVIQTMVDEPVQDAHRDPVGLLCKDGLSPRNLEELEQWAQENEVEEPQTDTEKWGRLFGGSALVLNVAGDPSKPLNLKEIERGRFALYPATRWELGGTWRYSDAYNFYGVMFDKSRIKTFIGKRMPWIIERQLSGWGASVVARAVEDFNVYLRGRNALYETINEFKIDVWKLKGYNDQLTSQTGSEAADKKVAMTNALKNFNGAIVLDSEDDYVVRQPTFSGLADVMRENRMGLVAATRIPASKLFGEKIAGLGDGKGDDLENYYNMVKAEVRQPARPLREWVLQLGAMALYGDKYHVTFEYPPLRETSAKEDEEVKTSKQNRLLGQMEAGLIDEVEAAAWAQQEKLTPIQTRLGARAQRKYGEDVEDVPARKAVKKDQQQGAKHEQPEGVHRGGDARQVPRYQ